MTEGDNSRLDLLLAASAPGGSCPGVVKQLVNNLKTNARPLRVASLRVLGNMVTGTDMHVAAVVSAGFLDRVVGLMKDSKRALRKEACWALSNITADSPRHKQLVIAVPQCASTLLKCSQDSHDVYKEATWAVANLFVDNVHGVVGPAVAAGYLGVLLACCAKVDGEDGHLPIICKEAVQAVADACSLPHVREVVWAQMTGCAAYPALLDCAVEDITEPLAEVLEEHFDTEYTDIMRSDMGYDAAIASLQGLLDGTAPSVSFGAGSGAQGKGKGKGKGTGDGTPLNNAATSVAATAALAAAPSAQQETHSNAEPVPQDFGSFSFS